MFQAICRANIAIVTLAVSLLLQPCVGGAQSAPTTAAVTGVVQQSDGSSVANANVQLVGATTLNTQSDANGTFAFLKVPLGNYRIVVNVKGLGQATREHIVVAGDMEVSVRYEPTSLNGLQLIASVSVANRAQVSTVPVTTITGQTLADQGQNNWAHVLNEIPGVTLHSTSNTNNSATLTFPDSPFAPQILSLGGALPYESSLLLDGMPLGTSTNSDAGINFGSKSNTPGASSSYNGSGIDLSAYDLSAFGSVNVSLGSNPDSPSILNSVGGNLDLSPPGAVTHDSFNFSTGTDAYGGTISNAQLGLRIGKKLSLTMTYDFEDSPGPQQSGNVWFCCLSPGEGYFNGFLCFNYPTYPPASSRRYENQIFPSTVTAIECCLTENSAWKQHAGSISARYQVSSNVSLSFFYEGNQPTQENIRPNSPLQFAPGPGYTGSVPVGSYTFPCAFGNAPGFMNQYSGLYEEKLNATVGRGQLTLAFLENTTGFNNYLNTFPGYVFPKTFPCFGGFLSPDAAVPSGWTGSPIKVVGSLTFNSGYPNYVPSPTTYYNGQSLIYTPYPLLSIDQSTSYDRDASLAYTLPLGQKYHVSASYTSSKDTQNGVQVYEYAEPCLFQYFGPNHPFVAYNNNGPTGVPLSNYNSSSEFHFSLGGDVTPKLNVTVSDYLASTSFHGLQTVYSGPITNQTSISKYADANFYEQTPRLGALYRANTNVAIRASIGGSYTAPPASNYIGGVGQITPNPGLPLPTTSYTLSGQNPNLRPEVGFQFALGTDIRLASNTIFSFDINQTSLTGQFYQTSTRLPITIMGLPAYSSYTANAGRSRFQGLSAQLRHDVVHGWYSQLQFGFTRGYIVSVPKGFYNTSNTPGAAPCTFTRANLNTYSTGLTGCQNLGTIPGINYTGQPYSQGFGSIGYRWTPLKWIAADATYYGPNNSYFRPAFMIFNLNAEYPLNRIMALHATVDNLTGIYDSPSYITDPYQNPVIGQPQAVGPPLWQQGLEYGPRTFLLRLDMHL